MVFPSSRDFFSPIETFRTLSSLKIIHALDRKLNTTSPRNTKKKYLPLNSFPLKFSLICGICKISDFYQRFLSFLFRSIYIIASTDFPKQRRICFETFSPQFHFLLSPARDNRKVHRLSNSRGHGMRAKRLQRTTFVSSAHAYHANEVSNT